MFNDKELELIKDILNPEASEEEAAAINCHMGGWDYTTYHNPSNAFEKYPLLHILQNQSKAPKMCDN